MQFSSDFRNREGEIAALFEASFTASEGAEEGRAIASLVRDIFATVGADDLFVFSALAEDAVVGAIVFTRLTFSQDGRRVFLLGPVAVAPERQGEGIGQGLLRHGLDRLRGQGVEVAMTYGDPKFYTRVGFRPISPQAVQPPLPLRYPEAWLGQSLTGAALDTLDGPSRCVEAFADPAYW